LTTDPDSHRVRDIKPGEDVMSVYDEIHDEGTTFIFRDNRSMEPREQPPKYLFYNEVDALEDQVLFPEEHQGDTAKASVLEITNALRRIEDGDLPLERFIYDLDTDEESLSQEDEDVVDDAHDDLSDEDDSVESEELGEGDVDHELDEIEGSEDFKMMMNWIRNRPEPFSVKEESEEWLDREKAACRYTD
jgi:hypothetical protein